MDQEQQPVNDLLEEGEKRYQEWAQSLEEADHARPERRAHAQYLIASLELWLSLVDARVQAGLSFAEMAKRTGLTKKQVKQIERIGLDACSMGVLERYALAVGKSLHLTLVNCVPSEEQGAKQVDTQV